MKKLISFLASLLLLSGVVYAGDNDARLARGNRDYGVLGAYGLVDLSDGDTVEVDDSGYIQVDIAADSTTQGTAYLPTSYVTSQIMSDVTPAAGSGCTVDTGAGLVQMITFCSSGTGEDFLLYDNTTYSGTLIMDIPGSTNGPIVMSFSVPIPYSTGLFGYVENEGDQATVVWKSTD